MTKRRTHRIQIPEGQYPPESSTIRNWQGREVNIIRDDGGAIVMVFDNCTTVMRRAWLVPLGDDS